MNQFLITGLPRSRTAWLANFLTYGDAFCFHEGLCGRWDAPAMIAAMDGRTETYVGNSDSGAVWFIDEIMETLPGLRLVVVIRDYDDVLRSLEKAFGDDYRLAEVPMLIGKACERLEYIIARYGPMVVRFDELGDRAVIKRLWEHCLPGVLFDEDRWRMLEAMQVQVTGERIKKMADQSAHIEKLGAAIKKGGI